MKFKMKSRFLVHLRNRLCEKTIKNVVYFFLSHVSPAYKGNSIDRIYLRKRGEALPMYVYLRHFGNFRKKCQEAVCSCISTFVSSVLFVIPVEKVCPKHIPL